MENSAPSLKIFRTKFLTSALHNCRYWQVSGAVSHLNSRDIRQCCFRKERRKPQSSSWTYIRAAIDRFLRSPPNNKPFSIIRKIFPNFERYLNTWKLPKLPFFLAFERLNISRLIFVNSWPQFRGWKRNNEMLIIPLFRLKNFRYSIIPGTKRSLFRSTKSTYSAKQA